MRLPTYVYSLIYPAFLGSFLYGSLTAPFPDALHVWAALLMLLYFGAQYGEGAIAAFPGADGVRRYGAPEAAVDLAETLAMAAIMAAIGVFGGAPTGLVGRLFDAGNDSDHWLWMALAFALPPIARVALSIIGRATDRRSHDLKAHQRLTLLSLSAATGAIIGLVVHPVAGLAVISLALGIYLFAFIFKPSLGRGTVHEALWGTPGED
ncbi:hypothetical protein OVY29_20420 [Sphingopyxis sp. SE2]|jgi:hypothetical protein|uniref:hypothetical protein n=1 Tax=unclassified Sphingopyxis TaxID=2614943 RepID=UPI00050FCC07|nr:MULTISPECIES: hypothetical protein [unclassified Sphingopyxis]KGB58059.1 hypothetical protein FG95_01382 [Sphingopyxis sp. LC363]MDT7531034.1 hypothetical protein [Sphingopyxis sp. SE2]